MAEARQLLARMSDEALEGALRDLAAAVAYPSAGATPDDVATHVRQRIEAGAGTAGAPARSGLFGWIGGRPVRHSLVVAIATLLVLAAVAGAIGLGVPGIRILFGGPTPPPSTVVPGSPTSGGSLGTLGQSLGLGTTVSLDDAARLGGLELVLPPDPAIGPPDAAYLFANRVALVWGERPGLPANSETAIGLLLSEFRGTVDQGYYTKSLDSDATVTPVTVGDGSGYWISGPQHFFFYTDPNGTVIDDSHRVVGDTLIWSDGDVTYRMESELGMDESIELAESLR